MAVETTLEAIQRIDFQVIGNCYWQIDQARDDDGKENMTMPPDGRPYELLFFLACRPHMQATRDEIKDCFWPNDEKKAGRDTTRKGQADPDTTLKTMLTKLTKGNNLPGGEEWQRAFPVETRGDFIRLKASCSSDMQEFWQLREGARYEENARLRRAKVERMREIGYQTLMGRPMWNWVARLQEEMRAEIKALAKTIPAVLPAEDLPHPGELPGNLTYPRNPYFQGREEVFGQLCAQLIGNGIAALIQALPGLGGMGKTETAVEFAYRCFDKVAYPGYPTYNRILWARADDADALRNGYTAIARVLPDFPHRDEKAAKVLISAVIRWLANPEHRGWLLILDNADHPEIIREFLPRLPDRRQGQVLLTSRSHAFAGDIHAIPMEPMTTEDALAFLYHRTGRDQAESAAEVQAARTIVEELGGLPLALEQTAAYLQQHPTFWFADYLAAYRKRRKKLLDFQAQDRPYQSYNPQADCYEENLTVRTTWDLNFREIAARHPRSAELLTLASCLAPTPIPGELVYAAFPEDFAGADSEGERIELYDRFIIPLLDYSLVKVLRSDRAFSVHVLVQSVLWEGLQPEERERVFERMLTVTADTFPPSNPADNGWRGRCALYYPHAEHLYHDAQRSGLEGVEIGRLLCHMGRFHYWHGGIEAEYYHQRALEIRQKALPADHPDIAESLNALGLVHDSRGSKEAEYLYRQALTIRQKTLPEDHPDIGISLNNLASMYQNQGRYGEAEQLYQQALALSRKVWLTKRSGIAEVLNNLGSLYTLQGRPYEAAPFLEEAAAIRQSELPDGNIVIGMALHNLANAYRDQGRYEEAEPLYLQAIGIWQKALPAVHPYTATGLNNLARLYQFMGRVAEAESRFQQALAMIREGRLENHRILHNFAEFCRSWRRYAEAEPLYQEAEGILLSKHDTEHPEYQAVRANYLSCLIESGKDKDRDAG